MPPAHIHHHTPNGASVTPRRAALPDSAPATGVRQGQTHHPRLRDVRAAGPIEGVPRTSGALSGCHVIATYTLIQNQAGQAAIGPAAWRDLPGVSETGEPGRPPATSLRAQETGEPTKLIACRVQAPGGVTRTMSCPVVHLEETNRYEPPHQDGRGGRGRRPGDLLLRLAQSGVRRG